MPVSQETFSDKLKNLIQKFEADKPHYLSEDYPEAQAKIDFITPLFKALGTDVENDAGLPHYQREVIVEKGGNPAVWHRTDYGFLLEGT